MKVGIIANPASGKDIRRLVAHGSVFDNQEKVRMVRRILVGLAIAGVQDVLYMPEGYGIVPRALGDLGANEAPTTVVPVDIPLRDTQDDSVQAAACMQKEGVAVIIVLGGDGTNRAVCKGARTTPLMPLSTGTNNVFPLMTEATIAGMAAGIVAQGHVSVAEGCYESSVLEVLVDSVVRDIALIDVAVYKDFFVGSRAVWDMERVTQLFCSRCQADSIGLSAVGGQLACIAPEENRGFAVDLDASASCRLSAAIGPGLFANVGIARSYEMRPQETYAVNLAPCVLAVDGERELTVRQNEQASVRLAEKGVHVVHVPRVMEYARQRKIFQSTTIL